MLRSPISSRNIVPPAAISIWPFFSSTAFVNAPFWWLNSVSENIWSSNPAILVVTKCPSLLLNRWIAFAISSLTTPVSPVIKTGSVVIEIASIYLNMDFIFWFFVIISENASGSLRLSEIKVDFNEWFSSLSFWISRALLTTFNSLFVSTGLTI